MRIKHFFNRFMLFMANLFSRNNLSIWMSIIALTLSVATFYLANIRTDQFLWGLVSQYWKEGDKIIFQIVVANNGNKPAIIASIAINGDIAGHGPFVFESLKTPLILEQESITSHLLEVPIDLSQNMLKEMPTWKRNKLQIWIVGLYADKQHYRAEVECEIEYDAVKIKRIKDCSRGIFDFTLMDMSMDV
jgi:hypothetical protein